MLRPLADPHESHARPAGAGSRAGAVVEHLDARRRPRRHPAPWRATSRRAGRRWSAPPARSGSRRRPRPAGRGRRLRRRRRSTSRPARRELATSWSRRARSGAGWRGAASPSRSTSSIAPNSSSASRLATRIASSASAACSGRRARTCAATPDWTLIAAIEWATLSWRSRASCSRSSATRRRSSSSWWRIRSWRARIASAASTATAAQPANSRSSERRTVPVGDDAGDHLHHRDGGGGDVAHGTRAGRTASEYSATGPARYTGPPGSLRSV